MSFNTKIKSLVKRSGLETLTLREKLILSGGLVFIFLFLLLQFVIQPFWDAQEHLKKSIARKHIELKEIKELQQEHELLENARGNVWRCVESRSKDFTLFNFLERKSATSGVNKQIKSMKPLTEEGEGDLQEIIVDMQFLTVPLEPIINFIHLIETPENCTFIKRISIREAGSEIGYFDVTLKIASFQREASL